MQAPRFGSGTKLGDPAALRPGDLVLALGHPLGVPGALSVGVLHSAFDPPDGDDPRAWIRADVRLAPGNSGGPLVDASGRVIGINTMIAHGLALAIPTPVVEHFVADFVEHVAEHFAARLARANAA